MKQNSKIYVAGHLGLVGSAIMRKLLENNYSNIITKSFEELDLRDQRKVETFFSEEKPEYVFLAAAKVGGIAPNISHPAEFIYDNLVIATNVIHASYKNNVQKLLFLGSSCIYPKFSQQPIVEEALLSGTLEPTNECYAIAKIAGLKMCEAYNKQYGTNFISCMPTNLYGPEDNFDLETAHVLPALIAKFYNAKQNQEEVVTVWGSGMPRREFLFVDDVASACIFLMKNYTESKTINVGTGIDVSIFEVAEMIKEKIGFSGTIKFDQTRPDGMKQKLLNVEKINKLGWKAEFSLEKGLDLTIKWYKESIERKNGANLHNNAKKRTILDTKEQILL